MFEEWTIGAANATARALIEIMREVQNHPHDSLVDIVNDALLSARIPLTAEHTEDDDEPYFVRIATEDEIRVAFA